MLWRALGHLKDGFYIDVGAGDPLLDSVTAIFYESGWSGINIEPSNVFYERLERLRPRDVNIQLLVSNSETQLNYWEADLQGISSSNSQVVERHTSSGFSGNSRMVSTTTLASVVAQFAGRRDIHFLKVDVEGSERDVIASIDFSICQPWILVIEATLPLTQVPNFLEWEDLVVPFYDFVYTEGLNRFYVSKDKQFLADAFQHGPNIFDGFKSFDSEKQSLYAERDAAVSERDAAVSERDAAVSERDAAVSERDAAVSERDAAVSELNLKFYKAIKNISKISLFVKYRFDLFNFNRLQLKDILPRRFPKITAAHQLSSPNLKSEIISEQRFLDPDFFYWMYFLREKPKLHNKQFQFYSVMDRAFSIVKNGQPEERRAIGFGVGKEPIPSALVALGYKVLATDYFDGDIAEEWRSTGEQSETFLDLNRRKIVSDEVFISSCDLQNMNMNSIPSSLYGSFDFVWSNCALGHIGSYEMGLDFILNSLKLLKPGGWAVHSTELDSSNSPERFESPNLSFYKLSDLEAVLDQAKEIGFVPLKIEKRPWNGRSEKYVVSEPWKKKPHLRIEIFGREINSVVIQIQRPN